jgi:hypothetical protein
VLRSIKKSLDQRTDALEKAASCSDRFVKALPEIKRLAVAKSTCLTEAEKVEARSLFSKALRIQQEEQCAFSLGSRPLSETLLDLQHGHMRREDFDALRQLVNREYRQRCS